MYNDKINNELSDDQLDEISGGGNWLDNLWNDPHFVIAYFETDTCNADASGKHTIVTDWSTGDIFCSKCHLRAKKTETGYDQPKIY